MRTIFMGTPAFAIPSLDILAGMPEIKLCGVFTQPDRPKGRGQHSSPSPVKVKALEIGVDVFQPSSGQDDDFLYTLSSLRPELIVVVAYGLLLPVEAIGLPRHGCVNVHASLLPKYRGAAPIQQCIIDGCGETGITTMLMDEGLDTGDIIVQRSIRVSPAETSGTLHNKLSLLGAEVLKETVEKLLCGTATFTPQNDFLSTYAPRLQKESGRINWRKTASEIDALIRGVQPWPTAYTVLDGKVMKIWQAEVVKQEPEWEPGTIIDVGPGGFKIATTEGVLLIKEIQMEGKKRMRVSDYIKGNEIKVGDKLGA